MNLKSSSWIEKKNRMSQLLDCWYFWRNVCSSIIICFNSNFTPQDIHRLFALCESVWCAVHKSDNVPSLPTYCTLCIYLCCEVLFYSCCYASVICRIVDDACCWAGNSKEEEYRLVIHSNCLFPFDLPYHLLWGFIIIISKQ